MDIATILEFTSGRKPLSELPDGVRGIPLTRGKVALVQASNFECLTRWKWMASWSMVAGKKSFYAMRGPTISQGETINVYMHRVVAGAKLRNEQVDHINHCTLDNRRENLRIVDRRKNNENGRRHRDGSSRFKGVSGYATAGKWRARIAAGELLPNGARKEIMLGCFQSEIEAAVAYDNAARAAYGPNAYLNFPQPGEQGASRS